MSLITSCVFPSCVCRGIFWNRALKSSWDHSWNVRRALLTPSAVTWCWLTFLTSSASIIFMCLHRLSAARVVIVCHFILKQEVLLNPFCVWEGLKGSSASISQLFKTNTCFQRRVQNLSFSFHPVWEISVFHIVENHPYDLIWMTKSKNKEVALNIFSPLVWMSKCAILAGKFGHFCSKCLFWR